ncbi:hypothetical protein [Enterobacter cloacae]|uniref:hypothetical protein n=1 Tax=Enterobacter cloacae TaxID=550 RepID=UPI001F45E242|nr:hypothetical protein [Enterobacter cloacae]
MSTITRERAQEIFLGNGPEPTASEERELARIALASLEAEPVAWLLSGGGAKNHVSFDSGNAYADPLREVTPLYTAPPAPVDNIHPLLEFAREYIESWDLGLAGDSSLLASAKQAIADSSAQQLAPVSVPDEHNSVIAEQLAHVLSGMDVTDHQRAIINCAVDRLNKNAEVIQQKPVYSEVPEALDYQGAKELYNYLMNEEETNATVNGWNACRAAMLQGAEPVTTDYKLPFEQWLSQQTGTIDVECGCVMTEVFFHWLRIAYEAGNSPVIPDGLVAVPVEPTIAILDEFDSIIDYGAEDSKDAWSRLLAAAWIKSLPAAPQQEA